MMNDKAKTRQRCPGLRMGSLVGGGSPVVGFVRSLSHSERIENSWGGALTVDSCEC